MTDDGYSVLIVDFQYGKQGKLSNITHVEISTKSAVFLLCFSKSMETSPTIPLAAGVGGDADGGVAEPEPLDADDGGGVIVFQGFLDAPAEERNRMRELVRLAVQDMRALYERFERDTADVLDLVRPVASPGPGVGGGPGGMSQ